jgi:hypothetical protein
VGGLLITRRLRLLALAASFWIAFAAGLAVLTASGHCMTARWAFEPVCGADYWRVVVASPEVLIFLFFMITDPKTIPAGQVARVVFGVLVAVTSVLLMAPQTDEFGTKVGLLAGLVVVCAVRPILDRLMPAAKSPEDDLRRYAQRLATGGNPSAGMRRRAVSMGVAVVAVLALGVGIVTAGVPARGFIAPNSAEILSRVPHQVDPSTLPPVSVDQEVLDFDHELAEEMDEVLITLAQNLELENQALRRGDATILAAVDHGDRLTEMEGRLREGAASGTTVITHYAFDAVHVSLLIPFGRQDGFSLGFEARGTQTRETYAADGTRLTQESSPFAQTFALRRATGARWLNVAVLPPTGG